MRNASLYPALAMQSVRNNRKFYLPYSGYFRPASTRGRRMLSWTEKVSRRLKS